MNSIDQAAYNSPWYLLHPAVKLGLTLAILVVVLALDSRTISCLVILAIFALLVGKARVSWRLYLGLMAIPLVFLTVGCVSVAITNSTLSTGIWPGVYAGGMWWGVSPQSLQEAINLLLRSLACVSAMYLLALTTPVVQLVYVLRLFKLPGVAVDLMGLIYMNIFIFLQTAQDIYVAQQSRCGYRGFAGHLTSLTALLSNLFIKNLQRSNACYDALLARGFKGSLQVLDEQYIVRPLHLALSGMFIASLILIHSYGGWICTLI
jgi:cobalt/nickel transport system permease protein